MVLQVLARATLLVAGLCFVLAVAGLVQAEPKSLSLVRIALNEVPVERVVEFGHEDGAFAMILPVPDPGEKKLSQPEIIGPRQAVLSGGAHVVRAPAFVGPDRDGVLPIDFTLEQGGTSRSGGVGVTKTIASTAGAKTGLTIFLIGGSIIEVERAELEGALAAIGAGDSSRSLPPANANGRLSLERVRQSGLDVRYDAVRDRLVLHP